MTYNFKSLCSCFQMKGTYHSSQAYGSGHINETFLLKTKEADCFNYILQKINQNVFNNIPGLMNNINIVTSHLQEKLLNAGHKNVEKEILTLIPTVEGKSFFLDTKGHYWRMYIFIWPNKSYDIVPNEKIAYEGGKMFGKFQFLLSDLQGNELIETIADFHNVEKRLNTFNNVLQKDSYNRAKSLKKEIDFIRAASKSMSKIMDLGNKGLIPQRVTHNDTKFNNVLLDENEKGLCVIDLDTVMPGYIHYDFGDAIRTATNKGAEDEIDLNKVEMDLDIFKGFSEGFLGETKEILNKEEIENLVFSGQLMTFTIGLRFLTDYLDGDRYFKIHSEDHNLNRARAQLQLLKSQIEQRDSMEKIIENIIAEQ